MKKLFLSLQGQPLRLEFSTKTTIKEVPDPTDYISSVSDYTVINNEISTNDLFSHVAENAAHYYPEKVVVLSSKY